MRCSYRCNMWCNCKKPAKPYPTTPSVSGPGVDSVDVSTSSTAVFFTYTPADATLNISFSSTDGNIAYADYLEYSGGQGHFTIYGGSEYGNATVTYTNNDNPSETYSISATRAQSDPFNPTNSIYVTKDTPGEIAQTKKRRTKKTLATAMGEVYQAKIFAVDSSSSNYILMEWLYGGDAQITTWIGNTYNDYTANLFNDQTMLNKIAREIEDYDNRHLLGENVTKFSDDTWYQMGNYFNSEYSPELANTVKGYIIEHGGTRFVTPYFNPEISDTSGNVGDLVTIRGWMPNVGGLFLKDEYMCEIVSNGWEYTESYNYYINIRLLSEGTSAVGFQTYDGYVGTIDVTASSSSIPVESISITPTEIQLTQSMGQSFNFDCLPGNANDASNVTVIVSDPSILYFDSAQAFGEGYCLFSFDPTNVGTTTAEVFVNGVSQGTITAIVNPFIHVESIDQTVYSVTTFAGGATYYNIPITPSPVSSCAVDITAYSDDTSIAEVSRENEEAGVLVIQGLAEGNTQFHYYLNSAPETIYDVDVTITPFVHVESISQGETTATVVLGENTTYTIPITPSEVSACHDDVIAESDGWDVAYPAGWADPTRGVFYIYGAGEGTTQLHYYLGTDPETKYDIDVTVIAPQPTVVTVPVAVREGQESYGSVSDSSATAEVGTQITTSGNTVTIGNTTITATANAGYEFDEWFIFAGTDDYISADVDNHVAAHFRAVL